MSQKLDQEIEALAVMPLEDLRAEWRRRFGGPVPSHRSVDYLRRQISWRLQAAVFGGLGAETRKAIARKRVAPKAPGPVLTSGVRITREWKGRPYDVEVLPKGFLFEGKTFDSLSEIAREITGVRWNGPRFFGLRKAAARK